MIIKIINNNNINNMVNKIIRPKFPKPPSDLIHKKSNYQENIIPKKSNYQEIIAPKSKETATKITSTKVGPIKVTKISSEDINKLNEELSKINPKAFNMDPVDLKKILDEAKDYGKSSFNYKTYTINSGTGNNSIFSHLFR